MARIDARPNTSRLICEGCGCTDQAACPGGCHWVSLAPPVCSACTGSFGDLANAGDARGTFFSDELCPGSVEPAVHVPIYVDDSSGYCARCRTGFVA